MPLSLTELFQRVILFFGAYFSYIKPSVFNFFSNRIADINEIIYELYIEKRIELVGKIFPDGMVMSLPTKKIFDKTVKRSSVHINVFIYVFN
jgi:hypothetical protein